MCAELVVVSMQFPTNQHYTIYVIRNMSIRILYFIFLALSLFSCRKHSEFVISLSVKSSVTDKALEGHVKIKYTINGHEEIISAGSFTNGILFVKKDLPRNVYVGELLVYLEKYYSIPSSPYARRMYQIRGGINEINDLIDPIYRMEIAIHNVSCQGATDTAWVKALYVPDSTNRVYTGCATGVPGNLPIWYTGNAVSFQVISKKNGVIDTLEIHKVLEAEMLNHFTLEY